MTPPEPRPQRRAVEDWLAQWGIHNDAEILGLLDSLERALTPAAEAGPGPGLREAAERFVALHGDISGKGWPCNGKCSPVAALRAALEPRS